MALSTRYVVNAIGNYRLNSFYKLPKKGFSDVNINPKIWDLGSSDGGPSKGGFLAAKMAKCGILAATLPLGEGIILVLLFENYIYTWGQ